MSVEWNSVDASLDEIISLAASLKGHVGGVKGKLLEVFEENEKSVKKVHGDLEELQNKYDHTSTANRAEREALERKMHEREEEEKRKLTEYDNKIQGVLDEKERAERERENARGDAVAEKARLASLLHDLEEDASTYHRLRPSKPMLSDDEVAILRQLFLSSAVSGTGKVSFSDLKQIIHKYNASMPEGPLKKLFVLVENDTKGRMSYVTLVAVANDLAALVGDFRKIDTNGNNLLSRKEFRDHFQKLGFEKKSVVDALFRYADEDESDEVGFAEYVHLAVCLLVLRILYTFADFDKSGALSKDEVRKVLAEAHIPEAPLKKFDQQFTVTDTDNTNTLSYQEFVMLVLLMFYDD